MATQNAINISDSGIVSYDGSGDFAGRTLTPPSAGINITNADGISGNPSFTLTDDLAAVEALASTGIGTRTGASTWTTRTITASDGSNVTNGDGVSGNPTIDTAALPVGFVDPANEAQISFVNGTRTFTIDKQVTSFTYWSDGAKYTKTAAENIVIANTEGLHYVYYDGSTLSETTTFSNDLITKYAIVAIIYWDATNAKELYIGDEFKHTTKMSGLTHVYLHDTVGFALETGGAITSLSTDQSGDLAAHGQFGNEATVAWDEDAAFSFTARTSTSTIPVYYKDGADASNIWRYDDTATFGVLTTGTGRAAYNQLTGGNWQQTEVANNDFVLAHVFTYNDSTRKYAVIQGQADYATLVAARDGAETEIIDIVLDGLPAAEFKFLGTIIYQTSNGYANAVKSRTRTVNVAGDDYIDLRDFGVTRGGVSGTLTDHGALTGLGDDDHTQYLLADGTRALAGAWDMNSQNLTNVNVDSGTIDGTTIGGATPAVGTFSTCNATTFDTNVAAAAVTLVGTTLAADGTDANIDIAITPKGSGEVDITKVDIDGGAIDGTAIGAASASTGVFSALSDTSRTQHAISIYGASGALSEVGPLTNGQLVVGSTGVAPVAATLTAGSGVTITEGAGSITIASSASAADDRPGWSNIGISYSGGTFTVHGSDGTALSAGNPASVTIASVANPGQLVTISITANQTFVDDAGSSEIINNLFGLTTSVAVTVDVPFFLYACVNDDDDAIEFGISRAPGLIVAPATANLGSASSATADVQGSIFLLNDPTLGDYDTNPVLLLGSFRMQMSASDDWTVQALNDYEGIGRYHEGVIFTGMAGQFGANSGTYNRANGGTAPVWGTNTQEYQVLDARAGIVEVITVLRNDGGTDGAGAVDAQVTFPYYPNYSISNVAPVFGPVFVKNTSATGWGTWKMSNSDNYSKIWLDAGGDSEWADYGGGTRNLEGIATYKVSP